MADTQLIYVTLDLRRGLWISECTGAKIVCAYRSDLLNMMRKQGADIWCFEEAFPEATLPTSTFGLLSNAQTLKMLKNINRSLQFLVFKPSSKMKKWIEQHDWKLLSSEVSKCKQLEDKLDFATRAVSAGLLIPRYQELLWDVERGEDLHEIWGQTYVVQGRMGHAGSTSYIKHQRESIDVAQGTRVKISEFIEGETYTLNGYVDGMGNMVMGTLWKQLMNVKDWNSSALGTVGISAVSGKELESIKSSVLRSELEKCREIFSQVGYQGPFGLDLIWNGEVWYVIECNARLTASVSLQSKQDQLMGWTPLISLQANASINSEQEFRFEKGTAQFSQVILRNTRKRSWKTRRTLKSGIYCLNKERCWELRSRSCDLNNIEDNELMLLLSRAPQSIIAPGSDYATLVAKGSLHTDEAPLKEIVKDFYERVVLGHLVRNKELWEDRYVRFQKKKKGVVFLLRRPLPNYLQTESKVLRKHRQVEVVANEVLKLRAQLRDYFLVEKVDGTRGWLHESHQLMEGDVTVDDFVYPGKLSQKAGDFLKAWKGTPYLWGGYTTAGVDCSAFVQRYFWEVKGILLPKYSQDQKATALKKEEIIDMEDDDLLFMRSRKKGISHVGVVKNGKIWHSSLETGVVEQSLEEVQEKYEVEHLSHITEGL